MHYMISFGVPERMDSLSGVPQLIDSWRRMFATLIKSTLYGFLKWRLAKANTHKIELHILKSDPPEPDLPQWDTPEQDTPEHSTLLGNS